MKTKVEPVKCLECGKVYLNEDEFYSDNGRVCYLGHCMGQYICGDCWHDHYEAH